MRILMLLFCGLLILAGGCFYSFNPGGEPIVKTIAVAQFENKTVEAGLASTMTDLVIDGLIADGNLKVVSESDAEGILYGTLASYERKPFSSDEAENVTQYVIRITFDVTLKKSDSDEDIWSESFFRESFYNPDEETEEDGQAKAAAILVQDIINKTTKSW